MSEQESEKPADELASRVRALFESRRCVRVTGDDERSARLRASHDEFNLNSLSRQIGVSRETIARLLAGLPVHRGSRLAIEQGLALWLGAGKPPESDGR